MRRINKDSLTARVNNIARNLNLSQNIIYDRFFFDAFLTRLSRSSFKNNFILKGGMLVSNILGIETRSTMDIDFYLKKIAMRQEVVLQSLKDITEINIDDGVTFKINGITNIRLDDQYGGFQIKIVGKFDNIKHEFNVDIATGDPIIPSEWDYSYECLLTGELLSIKAYSLESVVAEKLETVFARQIANSRSKDFYDLYVLRKLKKDEFDKCLLQRAFLESCKYRQLIIGKNEAISLLNEIGNNKQINDRWEAFTKRMKYANNLAFNDVITSILDWIMIFLIESSISGQRQIKKENYSPFKFCHFLQRIYRQ